MSLTSDPLICISGDWNSATSISQTLWPRGCKLFLAMKDTGRSCKVAERDQPFFFTFSASGSVAGSSSSSQCVWAPCSLL